MWRYSLIFGYLYIFVRSVKILAVVVDPLDFRRHYYCPTAGDQQEGGSMLDLKTSVSRLGPRCERCRLCDINLYLTLLWCLVFFLWYTQVPGVQMYKCPPSRRRITSGLVSCGPLLLFHRCDVVAPRLPLASYT